MGIIFKQIVFKHYKKIKNEFLQLKYFTKML